MVSLENFDGAVQCEECVNAKKGPALLRKVLHWWLLLLTQRIAVIWKELKVLSAIQYSFEVFFRKSSTMMFLNMRHIILSVEGVAAMPTGAGQITVVLNAVAETLPSISILTISSGSSNPDEVLGALSN